MSKRIFTRDDDELIYDYSRGFTSLRDVMKKLKLSSRSVKWRASILNYEFIPDRKIPAKEILEYDEVPPPYKADDNGDQLLVKLLSLYPERRYDQLKIKKR